jgi:hypothetical protein
MKKIKEEYSIQEKTYQALKNLILVSNEMQGENKVKAPYGYDRVAYLNEICTINLKTARRGGHSTAAAKVGYEFFNNVLFLSPNYSMAGNLMRTFGENLNGERVYQETQNEIKVKDSNNCNISTYKFESFDGFGEEDRSKGFGGHVGLECKLKGCQFEAIIVDPAFGMKKKQKKILSEFFLRTACIDKRFLIYVG